jgi:hypothetical protein
MIRVVRRGFAPFMLLTVLTVGGASLLLLTEGTAHAEKTQRAKPKKQAPAPKIALPAKKSNGAQPKPEGKTGTTRAPESEGRPAPPPGISEELRGPTRIDFDDRLIQGQTNKTGAVYLFDRKETGISSMVRRRKSFKQLTLGTVYDR